MPQVYALQKRMWWSWVDVALGALYGRSLLGLIVGQRQVKYLSDETS